MVVREAVSAAVKECLSHAGKRRFTQSVDLAIGFSGVDWSRPEQRPNIEVVLPHTWGAHNVVVFADGELAREAARLGCRTVSSEELARMDEKAARALLDCVLLAEPKLMPVVARVLGRVLGPRGKLPRPITGAMSAAIDAAKRCILLKAKGKCLPTLHCSIGDETLSQDALTDNVCAVLEAVEKTVGAANVASVHIKVTMGPSIRIRQK